MENRSIDKEIEDIIQLVQEAQTDNFFELAKIFGRDPKKDYAGANLHKCDFSNGDLQGAILRQTDLSYANLSGTDLRGADLSGADLSGADLSNAKLEGVIVVGTLFSNNLDLNSEYEYNLKEKGAIFQDLQPNSNINTSTFANSNEIIGKYKPSFLGFLQYTFLGKIDQFELENSDSIQEAIPRASRLRIARVRRNKKSQNKANNPSNSMVIMFSWLLSIIFLIAFMFIVYQALVLKSERANNVIYNAFTLILGCFIGALTTYLRMASEQKN
jgi:uncharacterized protein YjbI with pentapeptide repeats